MADPLQGPRGALLSGWRSRRDVCPAVRPSDVPGFILEAQETARARGYVQLGRGVRPPPDADVIAVPTSENGTGSRLYLSIWSRP